MRVSKRRWFDQQTERNDPPSSFRIASAAIEINNKSEVRSFSSKTHGRAKFARPVQKTNRQSRSRSYFLSSINYQQSAQRRRGSKRLGEVGESCNFPTDEIWVLKISILHLNFPKMGNLQRQIWSLWTKMFGQEEHFPTFSPHVTVDVNVNND